MWGRNSKETLTATISRHCLGIFSKKLGAPIIFKRLLKKHLKLDVYF
jgi:hypothetical protein